MKRDSTLRERVLKEDNYRCQITGFSGEDIGERPKLEVHHWKPLGMGGSKLKDTLENGITLHHDIHRMSHDNKFHIEKWDRKNGVLEISDETHRVITNNEEKLKELFDVEVLYFYQKELFNLLVGAQERVSRKARNERDDAVDLWSLRLNDSFQILNSDAPSFSSYAAELGWKSSQAHRLARLWGKSQDLEIEWPAGYSATEYEKILKENGGVKPQRFWYIVINLINDSIKYVRTRNEDKWREGLESDEALIRIGKFAGGINYNTKEGLRTWKGETIEFIDD